MKIGELQDEPLKIIIESPSGRGKTALATTLGECAQLIDADRGTETCRKLKDEFYPERIKVDVLPCLEEDPMNKATAFSKAKSYILAISSLCAQGKYPYKVLIVDSFTAIADGCLRYVLYTNGRLNRTAMVPDKNNLGGGISQPEWGIMINELENFVLMLKGLPIHVILIAHTVPTEENGLTRHEIAIPTKKLPPRIPGYFDEIYFIQHEEIGGGVTKRILRTVESPTYLAKSRAGLADKTEASIGMKAIFSKLGRNL